MTTNSDKPGNGNTSSSSAPRRRSTSHPRYSLKQAEDLARIVFKQGPRFCDPDVVAKKAKFSGANNGSFASLRATASQFGLIVGDANSISVSEEWIGLLHDDDPQQLQRARQQAMRRPDLYKQLVEEYSVRQLPNPEKLAQQLFINPKYGILKEAANVAAKVFFESASYASMINDRNFIQPTDNVTFVPAGADDEIAEETNDDVKQDQPTGRAKGQDVRDRGNNQPTPPAEEIAGLFPSAIPLENDTVVYIYAPRRVTAQDKVRLKAFIDLMLEEKLTNDRPAIDHDGAASGASTIDN